MTPSPPTFSMASATSSPIAGSLCAEIVATCAFSLRASTGRDIAFSASTAALAPRSRPRFRSIALAPATTLRTPSAKIACARIVAVLVPSPTTLAGLLRRLAQHLRAEVLLRVLEAELLGDRDAVVADDRRAPALLDQHRLRLRPERDRARRPPSSVAPCRIFSRAAERNMHLLVCHCGSPRWIASPDRAI